MTIIYKGTSANAPTFNSSTGEWTCPNVNADNDPIQINGMGVSQEWRLSCTDEESTNEVTEFVGPGLKK